METRIVRVNLLQGKITEEGVPERYRSLGGRGLTSTILSEEVDPECDPLGSENKLIFASGVFGGTIIPNCDRLSVGAKSPLTGGIRESNVGGVVGQMLAQHYIKAIIVENYSDSGTKYLEISESGIFLRDFSDDVYMGNYELTGLFHKRYNNEVGILSIGPAGMRKMLSAGIAGSNLERKPTRYAGRGGLGAVMGSKGLKAIVVLPSKKPKPTATEALKKAVKEFAKSITESPAVGLLHGLGTSGVIDLACQMGSFPTHSFTKGSFDKFRNINGEKIVELQKQRNGKTGHKCMTGCIVGCSNIFNDKEGHYVTSALEYETLCLLGSNLDIDDIETLAKMDHACDDIGIDTIEVGGTIGVAMDEGKIKYGDGDKALELIHEIGKGTKLGSLYGNGVVHIAKEIGAKRIPATMGQGHPGHDPRTLKGVGVTYATSPMGADHTAGLVFDPTKEGVVGLSREHQIYALLCDTFGFCIFVSQTVEDLVKVYNAFCNTEMSPEEVRKWAIGLLRMEVEFNEKAGVAPIEKRVSMIFREEGLPESGNIFDTSFEEMKRIFDV
jgi:aldehyde:ferredoxin oxidoreductase